MKFVPSRRQWLALAAVKLLALGAAFALPAAGPGFIPAAYAAPAADGNFDAALREFDAARADEKHLDAAIAALRGLPADPQRQPLAAACLGSALALQGKAAWMPWNKMKFTEQGLDQLDAALASLKPEHGAVLVRGVPVALQTRLVAAATFVAVPDGLFHRRADGRKLLAALRADPLLAVAPAAFRAEVEAAEARLAESAK
ncbi:MAG: hypothetical protein U1A72_19230 [Sulfuritalea sp.]|nr:hypothetical protein [Sulfuritalea sp.]